MVEIIMKIMYSMEVINETIEIIDGKRLITTEFSNGEIIMTEEDIE